MSNDFLSSEGEEHHQGLARTHRLSNGSIHFFLSHSELDVGDRGYLAQFRYAGPVRGEHVVEGPQTAVAPMVQLLTLAEQHPSDITFLPDIDDLDAGYLFVTEEYVNRRLRIYRWSPASGLTPHGTIGQQFPSGGPNFVFVDRNGHDFYLGIASSNWGWGRLYQGRDGDVFPRCESGAMDVSAFTAPAHGSYFSFPIARGASQCKLIRDRSGNWYLLGFRSDPSGDEHGTDYIDVHRVTFSPFAITNRLFSVHVTFQSGDTGFASTGTHHVEHSGRLLVASSYRWSEDAGPGRSSFVSRVDECPSS